MTRWSDQAWKAAEPVYRRIIEHPFVGELAAGSLSEERFRYYLRQDALYLDGYARRLAHIAARLTRKEHTEAFLHFALEGIEVERALHASFLGGEHPAPDEISPTCLLYTSVLESRPPAPVGAGAPPVLPCSVSSQGAGEESPARRQGDTNPSRRWIETYGDASFAEATARAVGICDELAEAASEEVRRRMTDLFVRCTRMEWMFWESAWNLEKWEI